MAGGDNWGFERPDRSTGLGPHDRSGAPGPPGAPGGAAAGHSGDTGPDRFEPVDDEVVDAELVDEEPAGSAEASGPFGAGDPLTVALDERDEYLDALRRLQAEFENFRKRVAKQQADQTARAAASLVDQLLPVLDTLDLAAEHLGDAESTDGKALLAASSLLHGVLTKEGLERIDPIGEAFDPTAHEAVGHLPAEEGTDDVSGTTEREQPAEPVVAQVMRPGYRWKGSVVRPAMVVVRG